MALRLHQTTNIIPTVYELRDQPTVRGGAVIIQPNGLRLFHRLGLYDAMCQRGFAAENLNLHSIQGHTIGKADYVGWTKEQIGFGYMRIKRIDLVDVLKIRAEEEGIQILFSKRISGIEDTEEGVTVSFEDGDVQSADMVIGCDGIHSWVRTKYVHPGYDPVYSGMAGIGALVPGSNLSERSREQMNMMEGTLTEDGMMAVNPCAPGKKEVFMFFSKELDLPETGDSKDGWEVHGKEEVDGFKEQLLGSLKNAGGDWGEALREMVRGTSSVYFYPVCRLPLGGQYYKGKTVLIGDAGHALPSHAGQGVSMAIEDVFLLAKLLADPERSLQGAFEKYEAIRRPRINLISHIAEEDAKVRKHRSPRELWWEELRLTMLVNVSKAFGLRGKDQGHLVYDPEAEEL